MQMSDETTPPRRERRAGLPGPGQRRINFFITDDAYAMMLELGKLWNPLLVKGYGTTVDRAIREAWERHIAGAGGRPPGATSTPRTSHRRGKA
jgi:hypothetical protein